MTGVKHNAGGSLSATSGNWMALKCWSLIEGEKGMEGLNGVRLACPNVSEKWGQTDKVDPGHDLPAPASQWFTMLTL
jgi:hypothetical protein